MTPLDPRQALEDTWHALGGAPRALAQLDVSGHDPVLPSSYPIGAMAAAAVGVAGVAAALVWEARSGESQRVHIDVDDATCAFRSDQLVRVDDERPGPVWNPISGFYRTRDERFVQLHTNFRHHLERTLRVLGVDDNRDRVEAAIRKWDGGGLEDALAAAGACATLARTRGEWLAHPQGAAVHALPLLDTISLAAGAARALRPADRPLTGIRVLDLTRVIAGPVSTRTLAAHGAEVLRVSSRGLPEIEVLLPDTSIGKRSTFLDLRNERDADAFRALVRDADVLVQSYRPGALDALGFGPRDVAALCPGIVYVSLSAYSHAGPWHARRGYDTLVQTASGVALAEGEAFGRDTPRHVPVSGLDHATGYFAAAAVMLALVAQARDGGAPATCVAHSRRHVNGSRRSVVSTARRHRSPTTTRSCAAFRTSTSAFGRVRYAPPGGTLMRTPARWESGPVAPGSDPPAWH